LQYLIIGLLSVLGEGIKLVVTEKLYQVLKVTRRYEKGQDLAEYSMLIGLIALLVVVSLTIIGGSINDVFNAIAVAIHNGAS
jgi:Flp pilus assembly pilin Flp